MAKLTREEVLKLARLAQLELTDEEISSIIEVFKIVNQHKNSPFEFMRRDKVVIMTDSLHTETISIEKIKHYLAYTKSMLSKAEFGIKSRI